MKIIKTIIVALAALGISLTSPLAFAECREPNPAACSKDLCSCQCVSTEVKKASGCDGGSEKEISDSIIAIINGIIAVLAIVAVIVIIYAGIQYMTSAGDASKLKRAKDTLLYAVIGLIICALAAGITNFAIGIINNNQSSDSSSNSSNNSFYTTYDSSQYDKPASVK